jgi:hypothetical protein
LATATNGHEITQEPAKPGAHPTHGYEATREQAMTAFAKSWRREERE